MYQKAVWESPYTLFNVPDLYVIQEMCERAVEKVSMD